ncbi:hypothetical protein B4099_0459 [Heyndrickxia coagulans]|uniref:Uncharacterized protein n=1 Tax=Heyndrickxia coagulans TaxID=1398 RepID=A0A150KE56_HEYCO|nr:hypothetical protein B4099_0459 [Heyndrickxia coagulans]
MLLKITSRSEKGPRFVFCMGIKPAASNAIPSVLALPE